MKVLVINPGGSSTKIAIFSCYDKPLINTDDTKCHPEPFTSCHSFVSLRTASDAVPEQSEGEAEESPFIVQGLCSSVALIKEFEETIRHSVAELKRFSSVLDQLDYRKNQIVKAIGDKKFDCVVTRGGPLKPLKSGTYRITEKVVSDIREGRIQSMHTSLLGPLIGYSLTKARGKTEEARGKKSMPAFFVDPESVDEFFPLARISGLPEIPRKSLSHFLNTNAVVRKAAKQLRKSLNRCNFIIAHLGSGITVAASEDGKQIDANNANEDGPFSPQRTGSLPLQGVIEMCYSGKYSKKEMMDKIQRKGGLLAYLGTDDIPEIEKRIGNGDKRAELVYNAMIYQIAKEIGSMYVALKGKVTAIIITGGIAYQKNLVNRLKSWIKFTNKPILVFPGEEEMTALAQGALRVLLKIENEQKY